MSDSPGPIHLANLIHFQLIHFLRRNMANKAISTLFGERGVELPRSNSPSNAGYNWLIEWLVHKQTQRPKASAKPMAGPMPTDYRVPGTTFARRATHLHRS